MLRLKLTIQDWGLVIQLELMRAQQFIWKNTIKQLEDNDTYCYQNKTPILAIKAMTTGLNITMCVIKATITDKFIPEMLLPRCEHHLKKCKVHPLIQVLQLFYLLQRLGISERQGIKILRAFYPHQLLWHQTSLDKLKNKASINKRIKE